MSPSLPGDCQLQCCDTVTLQSLAVTAPAPAKAAPGAAQHPDPGGEHTSDTPGSAANVGSACLEPAASLCPPTPFPTHSGQEKEQERAGMALGACECRQGVARGLGVPCLTFSGVLGTAGGARHGRRELARQGMTHRGWGWEPAAILLLPALPGRGLPSCQAVGKSPALCSPFPGCAHTWWFVPEASPAHPGLCAGINPSGSLSQLPHPKP